MGYINFIIISLDKKIPRTLGMEERRGEKSGKKSRIGKGARKNRVRLEGMTILSTWT